MKQTAKIFLCYAHEDEAKVKQLYQKLSSAGFKPWMDKVDLVGGEEWKPGIQNAIKESDFFIACVSVHWWKERRRFFRREIKTALDVLPELQTGDIFIFPIRLEECEVPEILSLFHWIDYFREDGWDRLVKAIYQGMDRLGMIKPIRFRSHPIHNLSRDDVAEMFKKCDFYDSNMNRLGKGIQHEYEINERDRKKLVIDHVSGLTWQQSGSSYGGWKYDFFIKRRNFARIKGKKFAGYYNWRLPTLEEAMSLVQWKRNCDLYINPVFDPEQTVIWTADGIHSSILGTDGNCPFFIGDSWVVDFRAGCCDLYSALSKRYAYIRGVRSGVI